MFDYQTGFAGLQQEFAELTGVETMLLLELIHLKPIVEVVAQGTVLIVAVHIESPGLPAAVEGRHLFEAEGIMTAALHVLRDLLEELGWYCAFEGERWKLETNGVYFIRE